jgi:ribosomal protein S18 acetylase RimI-like enzyme
MVTLRPMTEAEYAAFMSGLSESYAADRARAEDMEIETARAAASKQLKEILSAGAATPGHRFWTVVEPGGSAVGNLWVFVDDSQRRAFIFDIAIDEGQRGKGYGEATMRALEEELRPTDVTHIGLSVMGFNTGARALYDKLGYTVSATYMLKRIASGA